MLNSEYILWIEQNRDQTISREQIGGKAFNLIKLKSFKFPVPSGFIIKSNAYKNSINTIKEFQNIIHTEDFNKKKDISLDSLRKEILNIKIPIEIEDQINKGFRLLQNRTKSVCLRSSSTFEDSKNNSFAGLFVSILNLDKWEDVINGVREVWASNFSRNVLSYASFFNLDISNNGMAVIVQEFILAEKSGVMFTVSPIKKDEKTILIEANLGLGVSIVENLTNPDRYYIERENLNIIKKSISEKRIHINANLEKGITYNLSDFNRSNISCLSEREITRLAIIGLEIEQKFNIPQDIEWAILKDKIYILQTRPITTIG